MNCWSQELDLQKGDVIQFEESPLSSQEAMTIKIEVLSGNRCGTKGEINIFPNSNFLDYLKMIIE